MDIKKEGAVHDEKTKEMREALLCYALRYQGDWSRIAYAIAHQERWERPSYEGAYVTLIDEHYPEALRALEYAPWVLFYEGKLSLLKRSAVAVIGSRRMSAQGKAFCHIVCRHLREEYVVVSGLAKGIDREAHLCSLARGTIAVIGCGLDVIYPKENAALYQEIKRNHLLLSEYPTGTPPLAQHFPWRNRILAALSKAVVVVEAQKRSGTMLTVNEALKLGIEVYCMPYAFNDAWGSGGNYLISQGAQILSDIVDIRGI